MDTKISTEGLENFVMKPPSIPDTGDRIDRIQAAVEAGDLATVTKVMEEIKGIPNGNWFLQSQGGPLFRAADSGQASIVECFFSASAKFYLQLAKTAIEKKQLSVLDVLLRNGWNINEPIDLLTPPLLSLVVADEDTTNWFLAHGADPNAEAPYLDLTPLSAAVEYADFKIVKLLFDNGGSIEHGQLLHHAAYRTLDDRTQVLEYLVEKGLSVNDVRYQNRPNCYDMQKSWSLGTPLHYAANRGKLDAVKWFLEHGSHPRIQDSLGQLPVDRAGARGHYDIVEFLRPITESASEPSEQFTEGRRGNFGTPVDTATVVEGHF